MSRLQLATSDREKFNCPEWLERVDEAITLNECAAVEEAGGNWRDWPSPGEQMTLPTYKVWIWVALHRNGVKPPVFAEFDFKMSFDYQASPGKATSAPSGRATKTPSGGTRAGGSTRRNKAS